MENIYLTEGLAEYVLTLFHKDFRGVCIDVGAYDPFWISNSWLFEQEGWDTYCIEPNPSCIPRLKQYRKNVLEYACSDTNMDDADLFVYNVDYCGPNLNKEMKWSGEAAMTGLIDHSKHQLPNIAESHNSWLSKVVKVKVRTLDWLMENEIKKDHIDYLSIDVERNELAVLKGTTITKWKPTVICIESLGRDLCYDSAIWGELWKNPTEQDKILQDSGYRYIYRLNANDVYILDDYYLNVLPTIGVN